MHKSKGMIVILLGLKYDQRPLAFVSKLLLLRKFFKVLALRILELRTSNVAHKHIQANKCK
jgi:hypothetical protein